MGERESDIEGDRHGHHYFSYPKVSINQIYGIHTLLQASFTQR